MRHCRCCGAPFVLRNPVTWVEADFYMVLVNCECGSTMAVVLFGSLED